MHSTRTSTKLLLGMACAVSAVSGCVQVTPAPTHPAGAPAAGAPPQHEPRGGPGAAAVVVQSPALEALGALRALPGDSGPATAPTTASRRATTHTTGQAPAGPGEASPPVPDIPEPRRPAARPPGGSGGVPEAVGREARVPRELTRELPVRPADVCALGRRHGRWHPDSPEARICAGVRDG
ncbi:hypothetical protein [Streptomyces sp. RerS4]|uniref:hypothetical protein n=1 Tax=Streptomyces sp. RerS4 TaxID=2942449 RepID=UPI00201C1F8D|nr:hypothetical protein [Streptomyces sp. RerS4]UQX00127.1 hypothetical protein M4D82_05905 [Streptomyces sp. RerS4]